MSGIIRIIHWRPIRQGRALTYGFPLTKFGGFQGPISVNSKYFNGVESQLVEVRGKNINSSTFFFNFATLKLILCYLWQKNKRIVSLYHFYDSLLCCVHSICDYADRLILVHAHSLLCSVLSNPVISSVLFQTKQ